MFNIFLDICKEDYVGSDYSALESKMVHEICKKILSTRIENRNERNNLLTIDTLDELYAKFISIATGLPVDSTKWYLPLCNTYYSTLVAPLQDKTEEDDFTMPRFHNLSTKSLQLGALRLVCIASVTSYKSLNDEEKRRRLLSNINNNQGSSNSYEQSYDPPPTRLGKNTGEMNWHTPSFSETTFTLWKRWS